MAIDMKPAPVRISMIMQVSRVAPITLSQKDFQVSDFDHAAMPSQPSTPHAAHSVAVAQPSSSVAKTRMISSVTGMRLADSFSFSLKLIFGGAGGVLSGLSSDQTAM